MARTPKPKKAGAPPYAVRQLSLNQAAFEVTGNPIFAWMALDCCLSHNIEIPFWLQMYLKQVAGIFRWLTLPRDLSESKRLAIAIEKLELRPADHPLKDYADLQNGLRWADLIAKMKDAGGVVNQKSLIGRLKSKGVVRGSKAEELIALANRVNKRVAAIRKK